MASIWNSPHVFFKVGKRKKMTRKEIEEEIEKQKKEHQRQVDKNNEYLARLRKHKNHPANRRRR